MLSVADMRCGYCLIVKALPFGYLALFDNGMYSVDSPWLVHCEGDRFGKEVVRTFGKRVVALWCAEGGIRKIWAPAWCVDITSDFNRMCFVVP